MAMRQRPKHAVKILVKIGMRQMDLGWARICVERRVKAILDFVALHIHEDAAIAKPSVVGRQIERPKICFGRARIEADRMNFVKISFWGLVILIIPDI